jgi:hypothetical protein
VKRLASLLLLASLALPAPASAAAVTVREGAALSEVRITHVVRQSGKWLVRFSSARARGDAEVYPSEWSVRVDGVRIPRARVGGRLPLRQDTLERRDPTQGGWLGWQGPAAGVVVLRLLRDTCTWEVPLVLGTEHTPSPLGCHENE